MARRSKNRRVTPPNNSTADSPKRRASGESGLRFPEILRDRRLRMGWSQEKLAEQLGVNKVTVLRWEGGQRYPIPHHRGLLCKSLRMSSIELFPDIPDQSSQVKLPLLLTEASSNTETSTGQTEDWATQLFRTRPREADDLAVKRLQLEHLETERRSLDNALSMANQLVDTVYPGLDAAERAARLTELLLDLLPPSGGHAIKVFLLRANAEGTSKDDEDGEAPGRGIHAVS